MKMQPGKLLKPTEKELDLIKKIDEIYSSGMGREFENLVRTAINSEKERGHVAEFNPSGTFYAIDPSYLPDDEHRDIFRRLCRVSPSEPVETVSISTAFWFLPRRMIEPLPKARSI